jgi:hypothetical protein
MIDFKYMASWADSDGDEINYTFIVSGVSQEDAYESAKIRTNWFDRYYLTNGMKFKGLCLISVDTGGII